MDKEDFKEVLGQMLKEHLTIDILSDNTYYTEHRIVLVRIKFDGELVCKESFVIRD